VDPEGLERHLARDLDEVGERFPDVEFSTQLYRALANNRWTKQDELDGSVALSWSRAEDLVNELRERRGAESLVLAQTGGEGEIGDLARDVLERTGWRADPLDTSENDPHTRANRPSRRRRRGPASGSHRSMTLKAGSGKPIARLKRRGWERSLRLRGPTAKAQAEVATRVQSPKSSGADRGARQSSLEGASNSVHSKVPSIWPRSSSTLGERRKEPTVPR
jgi:hypothetical protein